MLLPMAALMHSPRHIQSHQSCCCPLQSHKAASGMRVPKGTLRFEGIKALFLCFKYATLLLSEETSPDWQPAARSTGEAAAYCAIAHIGVSPAQLVSLGTLLCDSTYWAGLAQCCLLQAKQGLELLLLHLGRGKLTVPLAEATLAKEPLTQVARTTTAPAGALLVLFHRMCDSMCVSDLP